MGLLHAGVWPEAFFLAPGTARLEAREPEAEGQPRQSRFELGASPKAPPPYSPHQHPRNSQVPPPRASWAKLSRRKAVAPIREAD